MGGGFSGGGGWRTFSPERRSGAIDQRGIPTPQNGGRIALRGSGDTLRAKAPESRGQKVGGQEGRGSGGLVGWVKGWRGIAPPSLWSIPPVHHRQAALSGVYSPPVCAEWHELCRPPLPPQHLEQMFGRGEEYPTPH